MLKGLVNLFLYIFSMSDFNIIVFNIYIYLTAPLFFVWTKKKYRQVDIALLYNRCQVGRCHDEYVKYEFNNISYIFVYKKRFWVETIYWPTSLCNMY